MANFINPQGLLKIGENLFRESDASGTASPGDPGSNGLGVVVQNALEASNVEPVQELIDLITTQRSFELNSQAVQAGDQVLQQIANLRRS
jgi:flagellar basal-body rod protein FlgG